jgi:hypothetical protein
MSIIEGMIEQRRLARRANCEVKAWRITELQAWELADEYRLVLKSRQSLREVVAAMKRGEIRMFGAQVSVR